MGYLEWYIPGTRLERTLQISSTFLPGDCQCVHGANSHCGVPRKTGTAVLQDESMDGKKSRCTTTILRTWVITRCAPWITSKNLNVRVVGQRNKTTWRVNTAPAVQVEGGPPAAQPGLLHFQGLLLRVGLPMGWAHCGVKVSNRKVVPGGKKNKAFHSQVFSYCAVRLAAALPIRTAPCDFAFDRTAPHRIVGLSNLKNPHRTVPLA